MKAEEVFKNQGHDFWALVKYASEQAGYTTRKTRTSPSLLRVLTPSDIKNTLKQRDIDAERISDEMLNLVSMYISYRARILSDEVRPALMNRDEAKECFIEIKNRIDPKLPATLNRQKGDKRHEAYLSSIVAMFAEEAFGLGGFVNDAQSLAILTEDNHLQGIFSRRFDGVIPSTRDPIAIWEVKEYYGTTSFGSRVADGVYETLLDGYEINAFESAYKRRIAHYLFVDDRLTWWEMGKPYLCRIIDMLHTGHVDEVFFGRQAVSQWPATLAELRKGLPLVDPNHLKEAGDL
jgi:hypothetical protein